MKSWMVASVLSMALAGLGVAQHQSEPEGEEKLEKLYYLPELSQEEIQQFLEHPSTSILVCPAGTLCSLNLFLKGDLVELESENDSIYRLMIKQTFYLRFQDEQVFLSLDGIHWKNGLEMLTGMICLTVNVEESQPQIQVSAEAYLR